MNTGINILNSKNKENENFCTTLRLSLNDMEANEQKGQLYIEVEIFFANQEIVNDEIYR